MGCRRCGGRAAAIVATTDDESYKNKEQRLRNKIREHFFDDEFLADGKDDYTIISPLAVKDWRLNCETNKTA